MYQFRRPSVMQSHSTKRMMDISRLIFACFSCSSSSCTVSRAHHRLRSYTQPAKQSMLATLIHKIPGTWYIFPYERTMCYMHARTVYPCLLNGELKPNAHTHDKFCFCFCLFHLLFSRCFFLLRLPRLPCRYSAPGVCEAGSSPPSAQRYAPDTASSVVLTINNVMMIYTYYYTTVASGDY